MLPITLSASHGALVGLRSSPQARRRSVGRPAGRVGCAQLAASFKEVNLESRTIELCRVDDEGQIEECEVIDFDTLVDKYPDIAMECDRRSCEAWAPAATADELVFEVSTGDDEPMHLMLDEWLDACDDDESAVPNPVPEDVLLKGLGPDVLKNLGADASAKTRFHLHFGAGRLGLGLVVPAISASGVPFAVVNRPKARWEQLFRRGSRPGQLRVSVNSEVLVQNVDVVAAASEGGVPSAMPPQSLVFGSSVEELAELLARATSFSCSLGGAMEGVLLPLLSSLPQRDEAEQPLLFACENDHAAVWALQQSSQLQGRVRVVDCMVDRVCTGCDISAEGVDVCAEPWRGSIVVLDPALRQEGKARVPFCPSVVTVPGSAREAEYLCERKLSLVNGMHTVLAFMTLDQTFGKLRPGEEHVLLKYSEMARDAQRTCEAWRSARVARLLEDFGTEDVMAWHGVETREEAWELLLEHADHTLEQRFSRVDDLVSRVLGGGVRERWSGRLWPTQKYVADREGSEELGQFFAYCLRRDRRRAIARGCSVDDGLEAEEEEADAEEGAEAAWDAAFEAAAAEAAGGGCDVEGDAAELYGSAAERKAAVAFVAARLGSLTLEARRFFPHERAITHKEPPKPPPPQTVPAKLAVRVTASREPPIDCREPEWGI